MAHCVHTQKNEMYFLNKLQNATEANFYRTVLQVTMVLFVLFVLRLNVPVNNFSVMSGRSHRFLGN